MLLKLHRLEFNLSNALLFKGYKGHASIDDSVKIKALNGGNCA